MQPDNHCAKISRTSSPHFRITSNQRRAMVPNPPTCCLIHASMAGSRTTAPLNRSNSVLIVTPLSVLDIFGYGAPLPLPPESLVWNSLSLLGVSARTIPAVFYNPDRRIGGPEIIHKRAWGTSMAISQKLTSGPNASELLVIRDIWLSPGF